jgi:hypothetical protein
MNTTSSKVLFVTYGGSHARILRPVIERLVLDKNIEIYILALTKSASEFEGIEAKVLGFKHFFSGARIEGFGKELMKDLIEVSDIEETIAYMGQNFAELVDSLGHDEALSLYHKDGRQIFLPIKAMTTIIESISPDLVVTTNSPRSEKAAVLAAYNLGIKSLAIVDMFGIRCLPWFKDPDFADCVCVLSESVKDYLVGAGIAASKVSVTGNPMFDTLVNSFVKDKSLIMAVRSKRPLTVLWATQSEPLQGGDLGKPGDPELPIRVEKKILEIFDRHPDWSLIVRNHPSEAQRDYPSFVEISSQAEPVEMLLEKVDLVVTLTSTVGFQGLLLGTGLITIDTSVYTETMPYSAMGLSHGITDLEELEAAITQILESCRSEFESPSAYTISNAAENVQNEILNLL